MSDNELEQIDEESIKTLDKIDNIIRRNYLKHLSKLPIIPLPEALKNETASNSACFFPIKRIVYDREENNLQKMANVYIGAATTKTNVVIILNHPEVGKDIQIYFGVCDEDGRDSAEGKAQVLFNNLTGNFPGCQTEREDFLTQKEANNLLENCIDNYNSVSSVSGVASLREGSKQDNAAFFQGIEKLIDGMENRTYSAIIMANFISDEVLSEMQAEYENLYHMISPHAKLSLSLSKSNAESVTNTLSKAASETISHTKSQTLSIGKSNSKSHSEGGYEGKGKSGNISAGIGIFNIGGTYSKFRGKHWNDTTTVGDTKTNSDTEADTKGKTATFTSSDGKSISVTLGQSEQITYENKTVQVLMAMIDKKIQRLHAGREQGMFAVGAYFLSSDLQSVESAASIYKSIITGDNTRMESSAVNVWNKEEDFKSLTSYLKILCHPVFSLYEYETVTPASLVTSNELAIHMGLPKKSVPGIPVSSSVSFGRSINFLSKYGNNSEKIQLGKIYHLGAEGNLVVNLDLQSLSMHTLLCGTTGVGKSNSSYVILKNLPGEIKFLVIEPAKGEYKDALQDNVSVYGTNPYLTKMLRINPFRFCQKEDGKGIHILEHLDKLTAIFNVCWSMEAAMPAVLKRALELAYINAGWDLKRSENKSSELIFPTFEDVMNAVESIMLESKYSDENKGDYIGALCTRLRELTDGINGMIFSQNDLSDEQLFDENVIIDLSRIGSAETKSLIMGLILIRLQEYRQCTISHSNSSLKHITVIEEAHHLLKRTSNDQSFNGANLIGRSVEMLSNAFAEMRTYGEGFIIVDQSPEQLDKSVIKNTNTKIILRLPEYEDRKLVGKAMGLNEEQISELAKLPTGVASVYQNNWLESILVKIIEDKSLNTDFEYFNNENIFNDEKEKILTQVLLTANIDEFEKCIKEFGDNPTNLILKLQIPSALKKEIIAYQNEINDESTDDQKKDSFSRIVYEFFHAENAFRRVIAALPKNSDILGESFKKEVIKNLNPSPKNQISARDLHSLFIMLVVEYQFRNGALNLYETFIFSSN